MHISILGVSPLTSPNAVNSQDDYEADNQTCKDNPNDGSGCNSGRIVILALIGIVGAVSVDITAVIIAIVVDAVTIGASHLLAR